MERFKRGKLNVLVATAIGEEGLDIGEVDLIICYDSQSSPIRMVGFNGDGLWNTLAYQII